MGRRERVSLSPLGKGLGRGLCPIKKIFEFGVLKINGSFGAFLARYNIAVSYDHKYNIARSKTRSVDTHHTLKK